MFFLNVRYSALVPYPKKVNSGCFHKCSVFQQDFYIFLSLTHISIPVCFVSKLYLGVFVGFNALYRAIQAKSKHLV